MVDEGARHSRRLRKLRRAARRWSVIAGALVGAAAVLTPYAGLGLIDAFWVAAAGGAVVMTGWRWADYRALAAQPAPPALEPGTAGGRVRARVAALMDQSPFGRQALAELRRMSDRGRVRGSVVAAGWRRLDRATTVLASLPMPPGGPAETAALEAATAERELRELARRAAAVERGLPYGRSRESLGVAHAALVADFEQGVTAYEDLVGAAAAYVAEEGRTALEHRSLSQLAEAAELLRAVAQGFTEVRQTAGT
jgi:hypothetical protein